VQPPIILGGGTATIANDSIAQFLKFRDTLNFTDTLIDIRYYPKIEKFTYKVKPDTFILRIHDTLRFESKGRDSPPSFFDKNKTLCYLLAIIALLIALAILIKNIKK